MKNASPDVRHGHWTGGRFIRILCGVFCSTGHELSSASNPSHLRWRFRFLVQWSGCRTISRIRWCYRKANPRTISSYGVIMVSGIQISVVPGVPFLGIAVCLPTLIVLFAAAYVFGVTREQRLINLIAGFCFSVAAILTIARAFDPRPNSWADRNFTWIIVGFAPIAAAIGVEFSVLCRRAFYRKQQHSDS